MITEKKQLLLITNKQSMVDCVQEGVSMQFEVAHANSLHTGFNMALNLLPDVILLDYSSFRSGRNFKNIANFKSNHFLTKAWLVVYAEERYRAEAESRFRKVVDEFLYSPTIEALCGKIIKLVYSNRSLSNFWKDAFMGMFNIISQPVVLLDQNEIVAMNDAFKQSFDVRDKKGLKLTDFVKCENIQKVKDSLRNFARGKHIKASTKTALLLRNDKVRNARINFSKLNRNFGHQFVMFIDLMEENDVINDRIGTASEEVEDCFKQNSQLTDFKFTNREKEIIELLIKGYKTKDISEALFISPKTIEKHRSNIIKRTNSDTILESIIYAINHKLIDYQKV
ncbi:LuxR family transcriptional regulator [Salegentibacter salinarum]|uniref:LuxR family transcriptional regulator n=1 Tax=Salegentibacter salinarum TaxID=447422 RepID=A0A2N0TPQ7_9FLAO|nr:LuxR C-terminal-related transcriptional regulator [Salegentibacter salinarum]PKD16713.1 LuxR family transcriptional regulator [Salegentibacter salinarum]SKB60384.1 regulatory protein, luxR family [Salegentibacter salinarum]